MTTKATWYCTSNDAGDDKNKDDVYLDYDSDEGDGVG
jgi:hypothetical protein